MDFFFSCPFSLRHHIFFSTHSVSFHSISFQVIPFIHSFLPSFLPSFLDSCLNSFIPSFLRSFIPSFLQSFRSIPFFSIFFDFVPIHFSSFYLMSPHFILWHFMSFRFIPFHSISYHFIPCHFMSFRRIAFNPTSFHVISCHSMSFHLIPFCPMSFHVFDACMHSCIYSRHCFYVISQAWKKLFVYCARIAISLGVKLSMWAQARATPAAALVKGCSVHITPQKNGAFPDDDQNQCFSVRKPIRRIYTISALASRIFWAPGISNPSCHAFGLFRLLSIWAAARLL